MTHTGPGRNYPNVWLYQRRDLPVRVLKKYENWRLIQDPDGAQGWMLVTMLSDRRTAIIKPGDPKPIRVGPYDGDRIAFEAEPGVIGRINKCNNGWCRIDIGNHRGYVRLADVWGLSEGEVVS